MKVPSQSNKKYVVKSSLHLLSYDSLLISDEDMKDLSEDCYRCGLCQTRTRTVWSRGRGGKGILIIGEAPGQREDELGLPFVGISGQMLENVLASVGLSSQEDCKVINTVKCRPPDNRNPSAKEVLACKEYLIHQVVTFQPKLILTIGSVPTQVLIGNRKETITTLRGKVLQINVNVEYEDRCDIFTYPVLPLFHPAYLLRNPSLEVASPKWLTWQDVQQISSLLG